MSGNTQLDDSTISEVLPIMMIVLVDQDTYDHTKFACYIILLGLIDMSPVFDCSLSLESVA